MGKAYFQISAYSEAEQYFTRAQDICAQAGKDLGQADALYWLAKVHISQSKLTEAQEFYIRAQEIY